MFQRFAVTFQVTGGNETYTTSTVELGDGVDPRTEVAKQLACRRFGRADMADHFELELTPIGAATATP